MPDDASSGHSPENEEPFDSQKPPAGPSPDRETPRSEAGASPSQEKEFSPEEFSYMEGRDTSEHFGGGAEEPADDDGYGPHETTAGAEEAAGEDPDEPSRYNSLLVAGAAVVFSLLVVVYALASLGGDSGSEAVATGDGASSPADAQVQATRGSEVPGDWERVQESRRMDAGSFREAPGTRRGGPPARGPAGENETSGTSPKRPADSAREEDVRRALRRGRERSPFASMYGPPVEGPAARPSGGRARPAGTAGADRGGPEQRLGQRRGAQLQEALTSSVQVGEAGGGGASGSNSAPGSSAGPAPPPFASAPAGEGGAGRPRAGPGATPRRGPDRTVRGRTLSSEALREEAYAARERRRRQGSGRDGRNRRGPSRGGFSGPPQYPGGGASGSERAERSDAERARQQQREYLQKQRWRGRQPSQVTSVNGPLGPFTVPKGTIIPVAVESKVNSDLPGFVVMRVTADVKDRTKEHVLIPAGAEVVTDYGSPSAAGQDRLLVAASRLNLPDGRYVNFRDARGAGPLGQAGLTGDVDRHLLSRFGSVGALTILGTAVNAASYSGPGGLFGGGYFGSAPRDTSSEGGGVVVYPRGSGYGQRGSFRQSAFRGFAQQINQVIGKLLEKQIDRQPTIELPPGLQGRLILGQDVSLGRPYYENGSGLERTGRRTRAYRSRRPREARR